VISRPASRMLTSRPDESSLNMPAGANTEQPVTNSEHQSGGSEAVCH
jgi:hypothetical protein